MDGSTTLIPIVRHKSLPLPVEFVVISSIEPSLMPETAPSPVPSRKPDMAWTTFALICFVVFCPLILLSYNVVYTEGEVMQALFTMLIGVVGLMAFVALYRRSLAATLILVLGGALLIWQSSQARKWAMIHEDITSLIGQAKKTKEQTGAYPASIESFAFAHPFVKQHIHGYTGNADTFRVAYFMNDPGITYTYSSSDGFFYYPD